MADYKKARYNQLEENLAKKNYYKAIDDVSSNNSPLSLVTEATYTSSQSSSSSSMTLMEADAKASKIIKVIIVSTICFLLYTCIITSSTSSSSKNDSTMNSKLHKILEQCRPPTKEAELDMVLSLPGWTDLGKDLPSCQYSGYVTVNNTNDKLMNVHYYYIESENTPESDPILLWTNGGPGASSMYGMMTEVGPLLLNEDSLNTDMYKSTGIPTLFYNDYSWTKLGGVVVFDWPPPVGFSYCENDTSGDGNSCGEWNDEKYAAVAFEALRVFIEEKFPNFIERQNPIYLLGESYAGIYVPKITEQLLNYNNLPSWNFKGFAVGDGCVGTNVLCGPDLNEDIFGPWFDLLFLYGHGQFSNKLWDDLMLYCGVDHLKHVHEPALDDAKCNDTQSHVYEEVGGYFAYNLYDTCIYQNGLLDDLGTAITTSISSYPQKVQQQRKLASRVINTPNYFEKKHGIHTKLKIQGAINDYKCGEGIAQDIWVNQTSVRSSLHVPVNSNFFSGDNGEGMTYIPTEENLLPFYYHVVINTNLKVMIYNGDTDPGLNSFIAQNWTSSIGLTESKKWRPWTTDHCRYMGGYLTQYEGNFDFVTIRGSGHMVPHNKPLVAFEMMKNFIQDKEFGPYNGTCVSPSL